MGSKNTQKRFFRTTDKKCGRCVYLVTSEGKPYYCANQALYTLRDKSDMACEQFNDKLY